MSSSAEWKISMPIDTFEHPVTGSVVDVVSVIHKAQPEYYRRLGTYVMSRQEQGFEVHYESIAASDESELGKGVLGGLKAWIYDKRLDAEVDGDVKIMMALGYIDQPNEGLFYEEGSKNYDLADAEVLSQTRLTTEMRSLVASFMYRLRINRMLKKGPDTLERYAFGKIKKIVDRIEEGTRKSRHQDKIIIHRRNEAALEGVDNTLYEDPSAKVILIWGLGHFAGLSAGLTDRGYSHVERQEVEAIASRVVLWDSLDKSQKDLRKLQAKADKARAKQYRLDNRYPRR